jgi:hypothetical protein
MSHTDLRQPDLAAPRASGNAEFAEAEVRLLDSYGYRPGGADPLAPRARDVGRSLTEAAIAPETGTGYGPAVMTGVDRAIRVSTAVAVLAVAGVAAYVSYCHAYAVVCAHGETGITARLEPATIDGLVYASSMVNLYAARHRLPVPALARWLLALGIIATLAANMAQGWSHGPVGAVIAAWPAVSLVGSYELLVWIIRTATAGGLGREPASEHADWCADHPAHGRPGASMPEATLDSEVAHAGLVPGCENGTQDQTRGPEVDQGSGPGQAAIPDHADQDADQIRAGSGHAGAGRDESETIAAAVAAYRASIQTGKPLSERKLAGMFGKTSRRWARSRMAEARRALATA